MSRVIEVRQDTQKIINNNRLPKVCAYIITQGVNKGRNCTSTLKKNSSYCHRHHDSQPREEKKIVQNEEIFIDNRESKKYIHQFINTQCVITNDIRDEETSYNLFYAFCSYLCDLPSKPQVNLDQNIFTVNFAKYSTARKFIKNRIVYWLGIRLNKVLQKPLARKRKEELYELKPLTDEQSGRLIKKTEVLEKIREANKPSLTIKDSTETKTVNICTTDVYIPNTNASDNTCDSLIKEINDREETKTVSPDISLIGLSPEEMKKKADLWLYENWQNHTRFYNRDYGDLFNHIDFDETQGWDSVVRVSLVLRYEEGMLNYNKSIAESEKKIRILKIPTRMEKDKPTYRDHSKTYSTSVNSASVIGF